MASSSSCCIRRDIVSFEEDGGGLFDDVCDLCTVVLCCGEKPARLDSVRAQLPRLRPLRRVELCFFAGRKRCGGSAHPAHDLARNVRYLFEDALARGVRRLLVLEDDFLVPRPLTPAEATSISTFLGSQAEEDDVDVYGLGNCALPTIDTLFGEHHRAAFSYLMCSHACFFSSRYMRAVVDGFAERDIPADFPPVDHWPWHLKASAFYYHKPLVLQTFPPTENQVESWKRSAGKDHVNLELLFETIRALRLHEQPQPGWNLIYLSGYVFYSLLLLGVAALVRVAQR